MRKYAPVREEHTRWVGREGKDKKIPGLSDIVDSPYT